MGPAYTYNKTVGIFQTVCKIIYLICGKNFWFEDMKYPPIFMKMYNVICKVLDVISFVSVISACGSFYTQHNLTDEQSNDMRIFTLGHIILYSPYINILYYKREIRALVQTLGVRLKEVCNDEMAERMMIKTTTRYILVISLGCSCLILYGVESGVQALTSTDTEPVSRVIRPVPVWRKHIKDTYTHLTQNRYTHFLLAADARTEPEDCSYATFTTLIPVWPDVEDRRLIAAIARVLHYIVWWAIALRACSFYFIIITCTIGVGYQFKNLCKYFEGLNNIFEEEGTQRDKEKRYEYAFKVGIEMHSLTLWCTEQMQLVGGVVFSAQMMDTVSGLVLFMIQIMDVDRSLVAVIPVVALACTCLICTGIFMWNAGDIPFEASHLPTAMFHSGWHNCQKESSVRVRKMVTIAITQAQRQVVLKGLWIIELSYENFVTICKSTYSLFSVIY